MGAAAKQAALGKAEFYEVGVVGSENSHTAVKLTPRGQAKLVGKSATMTKKTAFQGKKLGAKSKAKAGAKVKPNLKGKRKEKSDILSRTSPPVISSAPSGYAAAAAAVKAQ